MSEDALTLAVRGGMTGPGGPFEIVTEDVRGRPLPVFAERKGSMRQALADAEAFAEREFLVLDEQRLTYADVIAQTASVAAALRDRHGVGPGDRVAILSANRPDWVVAYFATLSLGAIVSALNGWWTTDEIDHGLKLSEPKVLFVDTKRGARLPADVGDVAVVDFETDAYETYRNHASDGLPEQPIDEDDPALILFTSGTTGRPKGALVSHRGLIGFVQGMLYAGAERAVVAAQRAGTEPGGERPQQVTLGTSPLFHVSGLLAGVNIGVFIGAKLVYRSGRFDPADVLRLIEKERITSWSAMGAMGPRVLACPELATTDVSSVTNVGFGGAPVSEQLQNRLREAFPGSALNMGIGFGSSESVGVICSIGGQDYVDHPDSVGRANLNWDLEIRDGDGNVLPEGVDGEIHVRSSMTMLGYWGNDEATAEAFDDQGFLSMGDIGKVVDGRLYINSRARDMILRNAENIYPVEIEHRLEQHDDVAEAAVYGVDHPEFGQEVKAVVVPVPGRTVEPEAVAAFAAETLSGHKVPSLWEVRSEPLPRNATGKVLKGVLRGDQEITQVEE